MHRSATVSPCRAAAEFVAAATALWAGSAGAQKAECVPPCRTGYLCHKGQCVSKCNPPCAPGETCTGEGECVSAAAASPAPAAVAAPVVAPAAPPPHAPVAAPVTPPPPAAAGTVVSSASPTGDERTWFVSAKAGMLAGGEAYVELLDDTRDTEAGPALIAYGDFMLGPRISGGLFAFLAWGETADGDDFDVTTLGTTIKAHFLPFGRFFIRPGLALGYQMISYGSGSFDDTQGFDVGFVGEFGHPITDSMDFVGEVSFISQPTGGNADSDLTFGPILFFAAGLGFGG